jgi:hypothetical protein
MAHALLGYHQMHEYTQTQGHTPYELLIDNGPDMLKHQAMQSQ